MINDPAINIFEKFNGENYKRVRKQMIGAILATDMALHFSKMGIFRGKIENEDTDYTAFEDKKFICE